jgi:hypothetical protein
VPISIFDVGLLGLSSTLPWVGLLVNSKGRVIKTIFISAYRPRVEVINSRGRLIKVYFIQPIIDVYHLLPTTSDCYFLLTPTILVSVNIISLLARVI